MARALVDTTVLFAAAYVPDAYHERALPILTGIDDATLPEAVVLDYVLAETLNGLKRKSTHDRAVDFLDRIESNSRIHVERVPDETFARAKALFRNRSALSLVDATIAAYAHKNGVRYLYAFDDDFDEIDSITRLETPHNPYGP